MKVPTSQFRSKLEASYAEHLFGLKKLGKVWDYKYEPITFRLGFDTRFTPDFMVTTTDDPTRVEFHEVKGFMRDDARAKLYTAATQFPTFSFHLVKWDRAQGWIVEAIRT